MSARSPGLRAQAARRVADGTLYLYVAIEHPSFARAPADLYVQAEVFDDGVTRMTVQYDRAAPTPSIATCYTDAETTYVLIGSRQWRTLCFHLPDLRLGHGQNLGADLRFFAPNVAFRRITVSAERPASFDERQGIDPETLRRIAVTRAPGMELTFGNDATAADAASLDKGYDRAEVAIAIGTDLNNEQYGALVTDTSRLFVQLRTDDPELEDLFHVAARIGPLVAELAGAKSSKDVATVLEAAAAPVGSYKAKYQRAGMSLNSFVGVAGGGEVMQVPAVAGTGATSSTSASFGGFVPVGLHATAPFCAAASGGNWFHIGATLSLIDLGALSTVRFKNDVSGSRAVSQTTSSAPNVGVGQIFAPGFYLTLGLFKSPIVVGAGGSLGPSLRTVNSTDANGIERTDKTSVFRFGGFLALDLTLMPF